MHFRRARGRHKRALEDGGDDAQGDGPCASCCCDRDAVFGYVGERARAHPDFGDDRDHRATTTTRGGALDPRVNVGQRLANAGYLRPGQ